MTNTINNLVRIGIFYDGYYFYKVSNYYKYEHSWKSRISISGLQEFIRNEVAGVSEHDVRQCRIVDSHYFRGRSTAKAMGDKVQNERIFEDILMRENIVTHYLPLRMGENNSFQEKGIDVWLALEAYELAQYKRFDIMVLVAGDGDYVPLVRKLNTLGTPVMLISWDFSYLNENGIIEQTKTSQQLLEEVYYPVPMAERIDKPSPGEYVRNLFVTEKYTEDNREHTGVEKPFDLSLNTDQEHFTSTIQSVKDGYGFIEDKHNNNVFFHFSTLENMDFNELKPGLTVSYLREDDPERSKREEGRRYRATKVSVVG